MGDTLYWIIGYILFLNIYLYWLMGKDKEAAKLNKARIPERHFLLFSALGGAVGCYMGMQAHRHKTKHNKFKIGVPVMIACHAMIVILIAGVLS